MEVIDEDDLDFIRFSKSSDPKKWELRRRVFTCVVPLGFRLDPALKICFLA